MKPREIPKVLNGQLPGGGEILLINADPNNLKAFATFKKFMEFLATEPTPHEICQHLVLTWPIEPAAVFAGIRLVSSDATMTMAGYFGASAERIQPFLITSLWEDSPSSRAVKERTSFILPDRRTIELDDPQISSDHPDLRALIAVPMLASFSAIGTVEVVFAEDLSSVSETTEFLTLCCHALTLYATRMVVGNGSVGGNSNAHIQGNAESAQETRQLSQRQLSILHLMSLKFTNQSIAMRLGFSESTIRQEAMKIFTYLNVQTRKQAVEQAILRELITESIDD
jgi:DNA-binding NarL/FixJ family response regulator